MAYTILHSAQSDVGCKRPNNEDRYLVDPGLGLFIVCDGMGGGNAGEVASALAVEIIHAHMTEAMHNPVLGSTGQPDDTISAPTNRLASAVRLANEMIYRSASDHTEWAGMGTTVVAAMINDRMLSYVHVGDSRLYLVRDHAIQPLTTDHSWVAEQVSQGLLTEDEAERSPRRHIVTRALGVDASVEVALGELPLFPDDLLILCSDGLTRGVQASGILHAVTDTDDVHAVTRRLVMLANEAGGDDNTTVIVLAVREQAHHGLWQRLRQRLAG